jgi:hypothetical protein
MTNDVSLYTQRYSETFPPKHTTPHHRMCTSVLCLFVEQKGPMESHIRHNGLATSSNSIEQGASNVEAVAEDECVRVNTASYALGHLRRVRLCGTVWFISPSAYKKVN